ELRYSLTFFRYHSAKAHPKLRVYKSVGVAFSRSFNRRKFAVCDLSKHAGDVQRNAFGRLRKLDTHDLFNVVVAESIASHLAQGIEHLIATASARFSFIHQSFNDSVVV